MSPDNLRDELTRRGLSIRGAARVLRVDPSTVTRWLSGDMSITDDRTALISMRLREFDEGR